MNDSYSSVLRVEEAEEGVGGGEGGGAGTNKKKDLLLPLEIATIIITVIKFCYHQLDPSRYY